jgi:hypothetical protein
VLYPLIYTRKFSAYKKSSFISSLIFVKQLRLFTIYIVVLESSINNYLRGHCKVLAINKALTITRLIFLIL